MKWQEVREQFPDKWLVFLAVDTHSTDGQRIVDRLAPIGGYADFGDAWKVYTELHNRDHRQEIYIYHTSNDEIIIKEMRAPTLRRLL